MDLWHILQAHTAIVVGCVIASAFTGRWYLATVMPRHRCRSIRLLGAILGLVSLAVAVHIAGRGLPTDASIGHRFAAIPFQDLWSPDVEPADTIKQMIGNVMMFIPLGIAGGLTWPHITMRRIVGAALALSLFIEIAQFMGRVGRVFDTTDVLLNVFGAIIGYACLAGRPIERLRAADEPRPPR